MSLSEKGADIKWSPVFNLKPHHAVSSEITKRAIVGKKDINPILYSILAFFALKYDSSGFTKDALGTNMREIWTQHKLQTAVHNVLRQLPDDAVIHLDLKPDKICETCPIGKHCIATNYKTAFGLEHEESDSAKAEQKHISEIHSALLENGYEEGENFIFLPTKHVLYDYEGKMMRDVKNPKPHSVVFSSMLIRMGLLREIARKLNKK